MLDLLPGDRLRLLPGENVPVDGRLLSEASTFDESLLTGEAIPVLRQKGDMLVGGACNVDQPIEIEVTKNSGASTMMEIHQMIARGLNERPKYAQIADRIAPWFVGIVLLIALATLGFWLFYDPARALPNLIALLIVTCPCALALATPVALAISASGFARLNVLPMRMTALEPLSKATVLAFDKTGTLTLGQPALAAQWGPAKTLTIAARLEAKSEHPFARALRAEVARSGQPFDGAQAVRNYPGKGVEAEIDGIKWRLGTESFALNGGQSLPAAAEDWRAAHLSQGRSVVMLANSDGLKAVFAFEDTLRAGVADSLNDLQKMGFHKIAILSGDNTEAVQILAQKLGISEAHGGLSPNEKLAWVQEQQADGERVVMVGDGINDAPVMTTADAAISFSGATELARQSADFVILGQDFRNLTKVFDLASDTGRIIRQNLLWAAGYNLLAVPAAAFGYVPPWAAAIGMSISSLLVVSNAMRLKA